MQHYRILPTFLALALMAMVGCSSSKRDRSTSSNVNATPMQAADPRATAPPPRRQVTAMNAPARTHPAPRRVAAPVDKPKLIPFKKRKDGSLLVSLRIPAKARMSRVNAVVFTPDGKYLLVAAGGRSLLMWTLTATAVKQVYDTTVDGTIYDLVVSPDSRWLALVGSRRMVSGRSYGGRGLRTPARRVRFESFLMVMDLNKRQTFLNEGSEAFRFRLPAFTADSKYLVALQSRNPLMGRNVLRTGGRTPRRKDQVVAFSLGDMKRVWKSVLQESEHGSAAVWDGADQVFYTSRSRLFLLDRKQRKHRRLKGRHRAGCSFTTVHHGRKLVATLAQPAFRPDELFLWQMPAGKLKGRLYFGRKESAVDAAFFGRDHVVGGASKELPMGYTGPDRDRGVLRIWSTRTGRLVKAVRGLPLQVNSVAAASTGWIALGGRYLFKPGDHEGRLLLYPPKTLLK